MSGIKVNLSFKGLAALFLMLPATLCATQAASEPFVFGGLTLGARTSPDIVRMATGATCGPGLDGMQVCNGRIRMGPTPIRMNILIGKTGTVQRIWLRFGARSYPRIYSEFVKAYGRPNRRQQLTAIWLGDDGNVMMARQGTDDTPEASIYFSTELDRKMKSSGEPPAP